jgi:hypothetical protein
MPDPCPPGDEAHCHGPYLVAVTVTTPPDYVEVRVPRPGGGPLAPISEITTALAEVYSTAPGAARIEVTETEDTGRVRGPARTPVWLGAAVVRRGSPDVYDTTPGVWTVVVGVWAPHGGAPVDLDYAYLAALWVGRSEQVTLGSGPTAGLRVSGVSAESGATLTPLPENYPTARVDESGITLTRVVDLLDPGEPDPGEPGEPVG